MESFLYMIELHINKNNVALLHLKYFLRLIKYVNVGY